MRWTDVFHRDVRELVADRAALRAPATVLPEGSWLLLSLGGSSSAHRSPMGVFSLLFAHGSLPGLDGMEYLGVVAAQVSQALLRAHLESAVGALDPHRLPGQRRSSKRPGDEPSS